MLLQILTLGLPAQQPQATNIQRPRPIERIRLAHLRISGIHNEQHRRYLLTDHDKPSLRL